MESENSAEGRFEPCPLYGSRYVAGIGNLTRLLTFNFATTDTVSYTIGFDVAAASTSNG
jgi:hypothetical protein